MDLSLLTLDQKIGQLFICGFHSLEADEQIRTLVKDYHVGGTVYFRRNVESVPQLAALSADLQRLPRSLPDIPLFISIDQEGGMVSRLDHAGKPDPRKHDAGSGRSCWSDAAHGRAGGQRNDRPRHQLQLRPLR
ncbi:glycoside hydrolase family 3 N-terminal domain-containing protein [Paenibacillus sanfengchensis]|uniref:glycoside hydrolase family 3 N-terminal domain-containing protein n=1 Tax=Paenibacillus sanfengchensis TaxID=3119819 RepID=UPI002FE06AF3